MRTHDGVDFGIRPIQATDKVALLDAFEHLGEASRYKRFLRPIQELTEKELTYLTEIDHVDHEALVAVDTQGTIIGVARYIRLQRPSTAEFAIAVVDEWQHRGIGTALLNRLVDRARSNGIQSFSAVCLATNLEVVRLLEEIGRPVARHRAAGGVMEVEIELPTTASRQLARALGAAATSSRSADRPGAAAPGS